MNSENSDVAKPKLRKFIISAQVSKLKEFNATLTMLGNWSKYILNGFCNFENFRNRILLSMT